MNNRFEFIDTPIKGLRIMQRNPVGDNRGYIERLFCAEEMSLLLSGKPIVQINHTVTTNQGTIRGLHFQYPPYAETKLITCLQGEVFDVAVDVRQNSTSFLQWHAVRLSSDNHRTFLIPAGFAHGLQTLSDNCEMLYFHTAAYHPECEGGLNPCDPRIAVQWPIAMTELSQRDALQPFIDEHFSGVHL
jgi:dTDP-4-dehydrorhamnose 3,5-epimerase